MRVTVRSFRGGYCPAVALRETKLGPAHLYRYVPAMDRTLTETSRQRPADEDIGESLTAAIDAALANSKAVPECSRTLHRILDESPAPPHPAPEMISTIRTVALSRPAGRRPRLLNAEYHPSHNHGGIVQDPTER